MNNAVFGKTIENVRKHGNIKLATTEKRRNYLVSETNYYTTKFFTEHLLAIMKKKTEIFMNKPVYLVLSIIELQELRNNNWKLFLCLPQKQVEAQSAF